MAEARPMTDSELVSELDKLTLHATGNNPDFMAENVFLNERYRRMAYGDEKAERSKVISNDVFDVVESDMPALARIFLGPSDVMTFKPNRSSDEERDEADEKSIYVDWQVRAQPWSFSVLHGFIKASLIEKLSVVKYFIDESTVIEEHKKTGLSDEEVVLFQQSFDGDDVQSVEMVREESEKGNESELVFRVEKTRRKVAIVQIPLERFRMSKNATSKDTAQLVGDVTLMTRGELVAMGFSRAAVSQLEQSEQNDAKWSRNDNVRTADEGGPENSHKDVSWASEQVEVEDLYPMIDFDGDGIAERRHIMRSGDGILINEVFNHAPYAIQSSILMPNKAIGLSRAEVTAPTARAKTAILRGMQDNIYAVNNPRISANNRVFMDDLLVQRPNGIIRTKDDSNPGQNMFAVEVPYIGDKALQVIQYWDHSRAQSTGTMMGSQGLSADDLGQETATRFEGVRDASAAKIELVARVLAETGFRQLYEGVAWLDANFQDSATEIEVLGKELSVNPADWKHDHSTVSRVGLGVGEKDARLQTMSGLWAIHQQLQQTGSPMTDEAKRFSVLEQIAKASDLPEVGQFFNNPEQPDELIRAQNEQLSAEVQQLQLQVQQLQNPLADVERIKAQAKLIEAQSDKETDIAKLLEEQRQFNIETAQSQNQHNDEIALKLTELETKFNNQLDAQYKQNQVTTSD